MPTRSTDKFLARSVTEGVEPTVEGYDGPLNGEVYAIRSGDAVFGIAGADGQAEAARKAAEEGRVQAESERVQAESARQAAEAARAESQAENDAQQQANNAQQLANNQAAQGVYAVVLGDGQYDPDTRKPTISGEVGKIYLVPTGDGVTNVTWMWVDGAWAGAGTPSVIETVSNEQIADVVAGEAPQGSELLDLSGLSEFWSKGSIQSLSPSASIPASSDLDDYTEAGSYSCSAEASATVTNKPAAVEGAFLLYVYEGPGGGLIHEIVASDGRTWSRPVPGEWQEMTRPAVLPVSGGGTGGSTAEAARASLHVASGDLVDCLQSQTWENILVGANSRSGVVQVSVTPTGSGTPSFYGQTNQSQVGMLRAGYRPDMYVVQPVFSRLVNGTLYTLYLQANPDGRITMWHDVDNGFIEFPWFLGTLAFVVGATY